MEASTCSAGALPIARTLWIENAHHEFTLRVETVKNSCQTIAKRADYFHFLPLDKELLQTVCKSAKLLLPAKSRIFSRFPLGLVGWDPVRAFMTQSRCKYNNRASKIGGLSLRASIVDWAGWLAG